MATVAAGFEDRRVSIGRVFSRTFGVIGRNPVPAFGISLLLSALPQLLIKLLSTSLGAMALTTGAAVAVGVLVFGGALIAFVLNALVQGALVQATIADDEGRTASFGECLSTGMSRALPLVGAGILIALAFVIGFVLLIVPACIIISMWFVALPAIVAERVGVFESLGRSRALTAGARWKVFGMLLVVGIIVMIISGAWAFLMMAMLGVGALAGTGVAALLFNVLLNTLFTSFFAILATSLYVELRNWKEGAPTEALGDIFS